MLWEKWKITGLSPRVRGNRREADETDCADGPIPAGAGEPYPMVHNPPPSKAYPRGCGGTTARELLGDSQRGLSPRVRGNQDHIREIRVVEGPIPAGAGEPG